MLETCFDLFFHSAGQQLISFGVRAKKSPDECFRRLALAARVRSSCVGYHSQNVLPLQPPKILSGLCTSCDSEFAFVPAKELI